MSVYNFKETAVYRLAFTQAMNLFDLSKGFPKEEKFALTDQIRRSSRSVSANLGEAYRKKRYPAHFISKLTDADAENTETGVWLEFSFSCNYLSQEKFNECIRANNEVGKLLNHMIQNPEKY